jgi:hypothetical protein
MREEKLEIGLRPAILPTAYCLLLTAYCLLLTAHCLLPTVLLGQHLHSSTARSITGHAEELGTPDY